MHNSFVCKMSIPHIWPPWASFRQLCAVLWSTWIWFAPGLTCDECSTRRLAASEFGAENYFFLVKSTHDQSTKMMACLSRLLTSVFFGHPFLVLMLFFSPENLFKKQGPMTFDGKGLVGRLRCLPCFLETFADPSGTWWPKRTCPRRRNVRVFLSIVA